MIRFSRKQLRIPYLVFLLVFVVLPLLVILYYALTNGEGQFTWENFREFFVDGKTMGTLFYSLMIAVTTTIVCLLIAYPTAYILARGNLKRGPVYVILLVMPMWINFTLRITAVKEILDVIEGNLAMYPFFNTILCMVYDFLPFMILPLYTTISKLDDSLPEAAADLGASSFHVFWRVMIPMTLPGIISGVTMVFLPAMTNYVVLDMIYNSTYIMGSLIGSYFNAYDWHNGSMISILLLILMFFVTWITDRFAKKWKQEEVAYGEKIRTKTLAFLCICVFVCTDFCADCLQFYEFYDDWCDSWFFTGALCHIIYHEGTAPYDWRNASFSGYGCFFVHSSWNHWCNQSVPFTPGKKAGSASIF